MQTFTVPQFIDTEDKIIGPITVRQFLIILAGIIVIVLAYVLFDTALFSVIGVFTFIFFGALAFAKINGRPFHFFILNFIQTLRKPKTRVWNHKNKLKDLKANQEDNGEALQETSNKNIITPPKNISQNLADLSLIVDTRGAYKGGEDDGVKIIKDN